MGAWGGAELGGWGAEPCMLLQGLARPPPGPSPAWSASVCCCRLKASCSPEASRCWGPAATVAAVAATAARYEAQADQHRPHGPAHPASSWPTRQHPASSIQHPDLLGHGAPSYSSCVGRAAKERPQRRFPAIPARAPRTCGSSPLPPTQLLRPGCLAASPQQVLAQEPAQLRQPSGCHLCPLIGTRPAL
jgi:hypothetical protein